MTTAHHERSAIGRGTRASGIALTDLLVKEQLAALVLLIALINASDRLCVITRQPGGDYQPGQFG